MTAPLDRPVVASDVASDVVGDLATFDALFRADHRAVVAIVAALCGSRSVAEEVAQEAFLRAHQDWARIERYERPGAWVRRVAINLALSHQRRQGSERRAISRLRLLRGDGRDEPTEVVAADAFWAAVRTLPPQQRSVVVLRYVEDRPVAAIAEVLDIAEGTVKAHLHKARAALARRLDLDPEEDR